MADADPHKHPVAAATVDVPADVIAQSAPIAAPRARRRWLKPVLFGIVPMLIALGGVYLWLTSGRYISTDNAYVQQDAVSVSPDVSGRIVAVNVRENQRVKAGDVLFTIDPQPYRIALEQADAAIAQARVDTAVKATDTGSAQADIAAGQADLTLAQNNYSRQSALWKRGFTTRVALDAAQQQVAAARAKIASAQAAASKAREQLTSGSADTGVPAAIQAAVARRDQAALNLQRTMVRAPHDGVISQTSRLQVGNITPSGVPALTLVQSDGARVEANFKETDLNNMKVGQPATVSFDAYPGLEVRGHVQSIGAGTGSSMSILPAQNATGNWVKVTQRVPVRVAIDGTPPRAMISGLSADVKIDTQPEKE